MPLPKPLSKGSLSLLYPFHLLSDNDLPILWLTQILNSLLPVSAVARIHSLSMLPASLLNAFAISATSRLHVTNPAYALANFISPLDPLLYSSLTLFKPSDILYIYLQYL